MTFVFEKSSSEAFYCQNCKSILHLDIATSMMGDSSVETVPNDIILNYTNAIVKCGTCGHYMIHVDKSIIGCIQLLNKMGFITYSSCGGHIRESNGNSYLDEPIIVFDPEMNVEKKVILSNIIQDVLYGKDRHYNYFPNFKFECKLADESGITIADEAKVDEPHSKLMITTIKPSPVVGKEGFASILSSFNNLIERICVDINFKFNEEEEEQ